MTIYDLLTFAGAFALAASVIATGLWFMVLAGGAMVREDRERKARNRNRRNQQRQKRADRDWQRYRADQQRQYENWRAEQQRQYENWRSKGGTHQGPTGSGEQHRQQRREQQQQQRQQQAEKQAVQPDFDAKKTWRKLCHATHPDKGGTKKQFRRVMAAKGDAAEIAWLAKEFGVEL